TKEELDVIKQDIYNQGYMTNPHITGVRITIKTYWRSTDDGSSLDRVTDIYYTGEENENE
ncbi:MAG: hypothetical protein ACRC6X_03455, partial [Culicoidibacterales bacterium]